jgi:uncharacterized membrane protein YiaA
MMKNDTTSTKESMAAKREAVVGWVSILVRVVFLHSVWIAWISVSLLSGDGFWWAIGVLSGFITAWEIARIYHSYAPTK